MLGLKVITKNKSVPLFLISETSVGSMKKLLNFSVFIAFLLLGGCVETSEQKHGEMIGEIIKTFGYPKHPMDGKDHNYVNTNVDVSSVVEKYLPKGISRNKVYLILDSQGFEGFNFKPIKLRKKVVAAYYIKSGKEYNYSIIKETPHYRIWIELTFEHDKLIDIQSNYHRWLNSL